MKMDHLSANMDPLGSVDSGDRDKFIQAQVYKEGYHKLK